MVLPYRLRFPAMRFFVLLFTLLALAGCADPCANTPVAEATSPDGKYVATPFIRDCGATTSFSPQVHLRRIGERVAETGNIFIGDHSDKIEIAWLSATQLVIYSDCTVIKAATNHHGIAVENRGSR